MGLKKKNLAWKQFPCQMWLIGNKHLKKKHSTLNLADSFVMQFSFKAVDTCIIMYGVDSFCINNNDFVWKI